METVTAAPVDPKDFESSDDLLAHIKAKCAKLTAWAHDALEKVTEHRHALPLGELLGTIASTIHNIDTAQPGYGVMTLDGTIARIEKAVAAHAPKPVLELAEELKAHFTTHAALESFRRSVETHFSEWVDELERRAEVTVSKLLTQHLDELNRRFPVAATVLHEVGTVLVSAQQANLERVPTINSAEQTFSRDRFEVSESTLNASARAWAEANAAAPTEAPLPALAWPPPLDGEFPALSDYVALGFYADTYAHQKAEWEARKIPSLPAVEPATDVSNTQENGPSDAATSAGSETA